MKKKSAVEVTDKFSIITPFTIKEVEVTDATNGNVLKIAGYANWAGKDDEGKTYTDLVGDVVVPSGVDISVWKSNPQILWQHDRDITIGRGLLLEKRDDGIYIECEIHKEAMDEKDFYRIKSGLVRYFSIGFRTLDCEYREIDDKEAFFITKSLLLEVSVVSIPANSKSGFSIIKALDGNGWTSAAKREDTQPNNEDTNEEGIPMIIKVKLADRLTEAEAEAMKLKGVDLEQEIEVPLAKFIAESVAKACEEIIPALAGEAVKSALEAQTKSAEAEGDGGKVETEGAAAGDEAGEAEGAAAEGEATGEAEGKSEAAAGEGSNKEELIAGITDLKAAMDELKSLAADGTADKGE